MAPKPSAAQRRTCAVCGSRKLIEAFPFSNGKRAPTCTDCLQEAGYGEGGQSLDSVTFATPAATEPPAQVQTLASRAPTVIQPGVANHDRDTQELQDPEQDAVSSKRTRSRRGGYAPRKRTKQETPKLPKELPCRICIEDMPLDAFPNSQKGIDAELPPECQDHLGLKSNGGPVCKECISSFLVAAIEMTGVDSLGCFECGKEWDVRFLQKYLSRESFESYSDQLLDIAVKSGADGFMHCAKDGCTGRGFVDSRRAGFPQVVCSQCNTRLCALCKVPWHKDMSCQEWRTEFEKSAVGEEEKKMLRKLRAEGYRRCPRCQFPCMKEYGCDNMMCKCRIPQPPL